MGWFDFVGPTWAKNQETPIPIVWEFPITYLSIVQGVTQAQTWRQLRAVSDEAAVAQVTIKTSMTASSTYYVKYPQVLQRIITINFNVTDLMQQCRLGNDYA